VKNVKEKRREKNKFLRAWGVKGAAKKRTAAQRIRGGDPKPACCRGQKRKRKRTRKEDI